jgi:hypothetical protein
MAREHVARFLCQLAIEQEPGEREQKQGSDQVEAERKAEEQLLEAQPSAYLRIEMEEGNDRSIRLTIKKVKPLSRGLSASTTCPAGPGRLQGPLQEPESPQASVGK